MPELTDRASLLVNLRPGTDAPARAREQLASYAAELLPPERLDDARLLVSDLVTDGVVHGWGDVRLQAVASPDTLRVEVADEADAFRSGFARGREHPGPALRVVERVADRWGTLPRRTLVWFELDRLSA